MLTIISQQDTIMQTLRNIQDINTNLSSIFLGYLNDRRAERSLNSTQNNNRTTEHTTNNSFTNRSRPPLDSELAPRTRRNNFFPSVPFSRSTSYRTTTPVSPFSFGLETNTNTTENNESSNTSDVENTSNNSDRFNSNLEPIEEQQETLPENTSSNTITRDSSTTNNNYGHTLRSLRNNVLSAARPNTVLGRRTRSQRERRERNRSRRNRSSVYDDVDDVLRQPLERRRNRFHTRMSARNTSGSQTRRREWLNIPTVNINSPIGDIAQNILNATMNDSPVRIIASRRQIARATRVVRFSEIETSDENNEENSNDETICPIDREILQPDDYVMQIIHCGHFFREENLRTHFRRNPRCPLCRFDIRDHGISNEELENRQNNTTPKHQRYPNSTVLSHHLLL